MKLLQNIKTAALAAMLGSVTVAYAAAPAGYYSSCENKGGRDLLIALHNTIGDHSVVSYKGLLDLYKTSDVYPDGKIWDMYSTKHWNPGTTCGNYSTIGDCYNREHSFPKSWFDDASPMYSDAYHLYPTDGKVNGQRSNFPYGECANGTSVASKGDVKALGKLGSCTFPGYSGKVFEPDDEYKGDFARSYFYMAACYYDRISGWHSDMLAGNNFPAFKTWAVNLLLKWHRQDPVSKKETDRNEVVAGRQHNRNPFIDHPELVEYIWGDKASSKWTSTGAVEVKINQPADGSVVDLGVSAKDIPVEKKIRVLTTNASGNVSLAVAGAQFSVSPSSLSAFSANAGADVTLRYTPSAVGNHSAVLTVNAGTAKSVVTLTGRAVDGLPVGDAVDVTDESFVAVWTYVGDADASGNYQLNVADGDGSLSGYPKAVKAADGRALVEGLMPNTDYTYTLRSKNLVSDYVFVRTAMPIPSIDFLFDGDIYFTAAPGEPSAVAEILISTDNIEDDYTVSVKAPFELSLDRSNWSTSITLSPDESRMYMRLNSAVEGSFETAITATAGDYMTDEAMVRGVATTQASFFEDFEVGTKGYGTYNPQTLAGNACMWALVDAGMWSGDKVHGGECALRAGKSSKALIAMDDDRRLGIGTVSFFAMRYGSDVEAEIAVEYSTDEGESWREAGKLIIDAKTYTEYKVPVNVAGKVRIRFKELSGKRFMLDDISMTDYSAGVDDPLADRHMWDAYSHSSTLFVDVAAAQGVEISIYAIDGTCLHAGHISEGRHMFGGLQPGKFYIVSSGDFSRTVLIR